MLETKRGGCAGRHAVIDVICPASCLRGLKLELSFRNLGGDAHGLGLKICPSSFNSGCLGCHGPLSGMSRGRLRNLGRNYTKTSKINRNMVTISRFPISVY